MQDRSLGSVELHIAELAEESDNPEYPYASTGIKSVDEPIRLDKGEGYKGTLAYTAEFVPCLALKNLSFGGDQSRERQLGDGHSVHTDDSMSSSDHEIQAVPQGVTIKVTEKGNQRVSMDSKGTGSSSGKEVSNGEGNGIKPNEPPVTPGSAKERQMKEEPGVEMSNEELLSHRELIHGLEFDQGS